LPVSIGFSNSSQAPRNDIDLIAELLDEALSLMGADITGARKRVEDAFVLARGFREVEPPRNKGVLARWQSRRVLRYIHDHLGGRLRMDDVARLTDLSSSYFSRAFKATIGVSYSDYVAQARLTLAKRMLLTTNKTICEIALACGLADQSHLTRFFSRAEGLPPRTWRRLVVDRAREKEASEASASFQEEWAS
jgi:AraC family transcriptional regulator